MSTSIQLLIARVLMSIIFIVAGFTKLTDIQQPIGMITQAGLPAAVILAWLTAIFEVVAGIAILIGFQTKIAAYLLALFCLVAGFLFHFGPIAVPGFSDGANALLSMFNQIMLMKNLAIAGGFIVLAVHGPGSISVDAKRGE